MSIENLEQKISAIRGLNEVTNRLREALETFDKAAGNFEIKKEMATIAMQDAQSNEERYNLLCIALSPLNEMAALAEDIGVDPDSIVDLRFALKELWESGFQGEHEEDEYDDLDDVED